jgi:hypothetical protein
MADYELIGLNEAVPDLRAPTSADRGVIVGGVLAQGLAELDGGADINGSRVATVADTNPLAQAVRVAMTAAASGSNGIQALYVSGRNTTRIESDNYEWIIYNRALSAAEVLSLCVNGPALADIGASQVLRFPASQLPVIGITGQWNAQDAQSNTGQIFDSSGNKNHALLPAAGATIIGRPTSQQQQVRWTNAWDGTNELQYIGGVNQAILPANAYIESIVGTVSGATPHDIIIGDGSDTDRYVTITTGLAAGTTSFTLANRTTDGTNLKLTVDPDTNATMSIAWVITYTTLE